MRFFPIIASLNSTLDEPLSEDEDSLIDSFSEREPELYSALTALSERGVKIALVAHYSPDDSGGADEHLSVVFWHETHVSLSSHLASHKLTDALSAVPSLEETPAKDPDDTLEERVESAIKLSELPAS